MARRQGYNRSVRVAQQILEVLATIMINDVRDPGVRDVQFTGVKLSNDLSVAWVYYVLLTEEQADVLDLDEADAALDRVSRYLRRQVAARLNLRHAPELRFEYDVSIERGRRIEALIEAWRASRDDEDQDEGLSES